jgi:hypothetical protein
MRGECTACGSGTDVTVATLIALAILLILFGMDDRQTLVIVRPGGLEEMNPAIRWLYERFGEPGVTAWFAMWAVVAVAWLVFVPWDDVRLGGLILGCAFEVFCTVNNYRKGIRP